jgi:hypothetical protein
VRPIYWLRQLEIVSHGYGERIEVRTRFALRCSCGWFTRAERGSAFVVCRSCGKVNDGSLVTEVV